MQAKQQNISPLKQRILQYVDTLSVSKREFYAKTGISRGTLENSTGITEDTLAKLFAIYDNISPSWLLTGNGDMLATKKEVDPVAIVNNDSACLLCIEKDKRIDQLERIIARNEKEIDWLRNQIDCNEEPKSKRHSA